MIHIVKTVNLEKLKLLIIWNRESVSKCLPIYRSDHRGWDGKLLRTDEKRMHINPTSTSTFKKWIGLIHSQDEIDDTYYGQRELHLSLKTQNHQILKYWFSREIEPIPQVLLRLFYSYPFIENYILVYTLDAFSMNTHQLHGPCPVCACKLATESLRAIPSITRRLLTK